MVLHFRFYTLILFLLSASLLPAQSLERSVINTMGGEGNSGVASITWSIGECITPTLIGSNNMLSQGFQQLYFNGTTSVGDQILTKSSQLYPNPATDHIMIRSVILPGHSQHYRLYNSLGMLIKEGRLETSVTYIPIADLAEGQYYIVLTNNDALINFKFFKSN